MDLLNYHPLIIFFEMKEGAMILDTYLVGLLNQTPIFNIPFLDKDQKKILSDCIQSEEGIKYIFRILNFDIKFSDKLLSPMPMGLLNSKYSILFWAQIFAYQCFAWVCDSENERTSEQIVNILKSYEQNGPTAGKASKLTNFSFQILLEEAITNKKIVNSQELQLSVMDCFSSVSSLQTSIFRVFSQYVDFIVRYGSETAVSVMLATVLTVTSERRSFLVHSNQAFLISSLSTLFGRLDSCCLAIFGHLSHFAPEEHLCALFLVIPGNLYSSIAIHYGEADLETREDIPQQYDAVSTVFPDRLLRIKRTPGMRHSCVGKSFSFVDDKLMQQSMAVANCLQISTQSYRSLFFKSVREVINTIGNKKHEIVFVSAVIAIINRISTIHPIEAILVELKDSVLMSGCQHIFGSIDEDLDLARQFLFENCIQSQCTSALFDAFGTSAYLVAEFFVRIFSQQNKTVDFQSFVTEKNLIKIVGGVQQLIELQKEEKEREKATAALSSLFETCYFLMDTAKTREAVFADANFTFGFLKYIFDSNSTDEIINLMGKNLSILQKEERVDFSPLSEFLSSAIRFAMKRTSDDYKALTAKLFDMTGRVIIHQPFFESSFRPILDLFIRFCRREATKESVLKILQFVMKFAEANCNFELGPILEMEITSFVKSVYGKDPGPHIYKIVAGLINESEFVSNDIIQIKNPKFVRFAMALFGESERISQLFNRFRDVIKTSTTSRSILHDCCVDSAILQYTMQEESTAEVTADGVTFRLSISDTDLTKIALPLVEDIITYKCDTAILHMFTRSLITRHGRAVGRSLEVAIGKCAAQPRNLFRIGTISSQISVSKIPIEIVENPFSITFSIYADIGLMSQCATELKLVKIEDDYGVSISVVLCRGNLFIISECPSEKIITIVMRSIPSNRWIDFTLGFQPKEDRYKVTRYTSLLLCGTHEIEMNSFVGSYVTLSVGGYKAKGTLESWRNKIFGEITNVRFYNRMLKSIDDVSDPLIDTNNYSQGAAPKQIDDGDFSIVCSGYGALPCNVLKTATESKFQKMIEELFDEDGITVNLDLVFVILKQLFLADKRCLDFDASRSIAAYMLNHKEIINFALFRSAAGVLTADQDNVDWLCLIVCNAWIWRHAPAEDVVSIFRVLANLVSKSPGINVDHFVDLLYIIVSDRNFIPQLNQEQLSAVQAYFATFVRNIIQQNVIQHDVEKLMAHMFSCSRQHIHIFQDILLTVPPSFLRAISHRENVLISLNNMLSTGDLDLTVKTIFIIHQVSGENIAENCVAAFHVLRKSPHLPKIFERIYSEIREFPGLVSLLCMFAFENKKTYPKLIALALYDLAENFSSAINLLESRTWFILPIAVSLFLNPSDQLMIAQFLAIMIEKSKNPATMLPTVLSTIELMQAGTNESLNEIINAVLTYFFETDNQTMRPILVQCAFVHVFFSLNPPSHNQALINAFKESPFVIHGDYEKPVIRERIESVDDLELFFEASDVCFKPRFSIRFQGTEWVDDEIARLMYMDLLKMFDPTIQFKKMFVAFFKKKDLFDMNTLSQIFSRLDIFIEQSLEKYAKILDENLRDVSSSVRYIFSEGRSIIEAPVYGPLLNSAALVDAERRRGSKMVVKKPEYKMQWVRDWTLCTLSIPMKMKPMSVKKGLILPKRADIFYQRSCRYIRRDNIIKAAFVVFLDEIRISGPTVSKSIINSSIASVFIRAFDGKDTAIEIFTNTGKSYLLDFEDLDAIFVIRVLAELQIKRMSLQRSTVIEPSVINAFTQRWVTHSISTFEYLTHLNILSGRSFNSETLYPVFPSVLASFDSTVQVSDLSVLTSKTLNMKRILSAKDKIDSLREEIVGSKLILPEFYFLPDIVKDSDRLPNWAENKHQFIIKHRMVLESPEADILIPMWIDAVFGGNSGLPHRVLFAEPHPRRKLIRKEGSVTVHNLQMKIAAASVVAKDGAVTLALLDGKEDGIVRAVEVDLSTDGIRLGDKHFVGHTDIYTADGSRIVCASRSRQTLTRLTAINITKVPFMFDSPFICATVPTIFFGLNTTTLACVPFQLQTSSSTPTSVDGVSGLQVIARFDSHISMMVASMRFRLVAVSTADRRLWIYSTPSYECAATVQLPFAPECICVTELWGFVVCAGERRVTVTDSIGRIVAEAETEFRPSYCNAITSQGGFDYVAFWDSESGQVGVFDAENPRNVTNFFQLQKKVLVVDYDRRQMSFFVVCSDGSFFVIPYLFPH